MSSKRSREREPKLSAMYAGLLDWQIFRAAQVPGPGAYNIHLHTTSPNGGQFSRFTPKGYCDDDIRKAQSMPGPGDYSVPVMASASGGRFNQSRPKSQLDWIALRGPQTPGPADTAPTPMSKPSGAWLNRSPMSNGSCIDQHRLIVDGVQTPGPGSYAVRPPSPPRGGRMTKAKSKTELDWIELRASKLPGPGQYGLPEQKLGGGKFNISNSKSELDWVIYRASQTPGPAQYEAEAAKDHLTKSTKACHLLGRTGPKTMPWPYGNQKKLPDLRTSSMSDDDSSDGGKHRSPRPAVVHRSPPRTAGSTVSKFAGRQQRPSSQVGSHPLAEDPASPLHILKRKTSWQGERCERATLRGACSRALRATRLDRALVRRLPFDSALSASLGHLIGGQGEHAEGRGVGGNNTHLPLAGRSSTPL